MPTQHADLFTALSAPFHPNEVKARSQAGRQLQYITARTAMNRLDEILGPENWWDEYTPGENSVVCKLTIRFPDPDAAEGGGWIERTKQDAGGYAGMPDQGDDDKSGFSDAFKRACVKFGVGRYLYRDGVPRFVREREPSLPEAEPEAHPASNGHHHPVQPPTHVNTPPPGQSHTGNNAPRTGRAMFAWTKEQEQRHEVGLLRYLNGWAKLQDFPGRMVDWSSEQVEQAHAEAVRKLNSVASGHTEAYEEALAH